ncbi:MFS transporter [Cohnella xylanilytica]|uniref:MFS transporter n=1 Tax=Cohnella xylanilytica TaxID=557555 RepID=A0A841UBS2_9BACL|nr:MFS transporter [Cohnella xylanilytica]MBB6695604.1 MFS transporter [Cohnella xylanilytica]
MPDLRQAAFAADSKRWRALFLLCLAQFMVIMDTSIIGVALPAIQQALGYSQDGLQWVFNAYVIFFGGLMLLGGRMSDLFGQRKVFMIGFVILSAASLLAGFAWSEESMNVGRAVQGLGSAFILPSALTIVMLLFGHDSKELRRALGFWGASAAAGGTAGVFLGGVITEWLSWSWTFWINVPVGLFALLYGRSVLPEGVRRRGRIDVAGAVLVTGSLVIAVYAIVTAGQTGWSSPRTIVLLLAAAVLLGLFLLVQRKRKEPLVPLRIFSAPNLLAGNAVFGLLAGAWIPLWFYLNLYLQQILDFSAFAGGVALVPMTALIMIVMVGVTGRLVGRFGFRGVLVAGLLLLAASLVILAGFTPTNGTYAANVLPASLIGALGMSLAFIPGTMAAMSGAKPEDTGLASGLSNSSYQIGSAIGLALMSAAAAAWTRDGAAESEGARLASLNDGFHAAFYGAAIIATVGVAATLLFIRTRK